MERGISKKLFTFFLAVFLVILVWLTFNIVVKNTSNRILSLIGAVLIIAILFLISRSTRIKIDSISVRQFRLLMLSLFLLFGALLLTAGYLLTQVVILDLKVVYESIPDLLDNFVLDNYSHYYVVCNNNVGILLLLGLFFKVMSVFGIAPLTDIGLTAVICFNALMIELSVVFLVLAARKLFSKQSSIYIVFICCFFCPVFYIWTSVFYTDTLSMPFITAAIYIYILAKNSKTYLKKILLLMLASIVAFLGFAVKGSVAVVVIAIAIDLLISNKEGLLKGSIAAVTVIAVFLGLYRSYSVWQRQSNIIDFSNEESIGLPIGLWFLYGSHLPGYYSEEDLNYCLSVNGLEDRKIAVNNRLKEVYSSYSFVGYVKMATQKAVMTWGDGKFGADVFLCTPYRVNFTHYIILEGQLLFRPYSIYTQGYHLMNLTMLCIGLYRGIFAKRSIQDLGIVYLILFGIVLFFNIWETTSRYLVNIVPLLCLATAVEMINLTDNVKNRKR